MMMVMMMKNSNKYESIDVCFYLQTLLLTSNLSITSTMTLVWWQQVSQW